jgi:ABC-type Zn uptake system ZnuABC Zn-binding protein ZnuA
MIGEELATQYGVDDLPKLAILFQHGKLAGFLKQQEQDNLLGGWLGALVPYYGTKIVDDHNMWPYFARTFGLKVVAHMEPKPGISPTTQHLAAVVEVMKRENVRVILASAYYDPRHARFLAGQSGARVINAANLTGARPGTENYLAAVDYNVRELVKALQQGATDQ